MSKKVPGYFCIYGALLVATAAHAAPTAVEIMTKNETARKLDDVASDASLTVGGGGTAEKRKDFSWWRKLSDDKVHNKTLTRFHLPAEIRGEGILFLEQPGGENEVMLYLPAFKKIRRVESQAQSGKFMGSEFSYSDIATPHVADYSYKLEGEEPCPSKEAGKVKCWKIESTPATDSVRERTGISKSVQWIRQDNFMGVKGESYDPEGKPWKRFESTQTKEVAKGKWMSHHVRVENLRDGKFTVLQFARVKANAGIEDAIFTQQNLARVK